MGEIFVFTSPGRLIFPVVFKRPGNITGILTPRHHMCAHVYIHVYCIYIQFPSLLSLHLVGLPRESVICNILSCRSSELVTLQHPKEHNLQPLTSVELAQHSHTTSQHYKTQWNTTSGLSQVLFGLTHYTLHSHYLQHLPAGDVHFPVAGGGHPALHVM